MTPAVRRAVAETAGADVMRTAPLSGGCIGEVWRVDLADGRRLVAKTAGVDGTLDIEGYMLDYLARTRTVPVPGVLRAEFQQHPTILEQTRGLLDRLDEHPVTQRFDLHRDLSPPQRC